MIEIEKIKMEHYRSISMYFMAIAGGQITLLGTVFSTISHKTLASVAIFFMLITSMAAFAVSDIIMRKIQPEPQFRFEFIKKCYKLGPTTEEYQYIISMFSAICFGISCLCFLTAIFPP